MIAFAETLVQILLQPKRSIGGITATVTLEEVGEDDLEITDHPVEQGASITDNAYLKPAVLRIAAKWAGLPLSIKTLSETYQQLLTLQASRIPFDIITPKRKYPNMLFKSLKQTTDKYTENCLSVSAEFKQIIIVQTQVTSVPPRAAQAQPEVTAATQNVGTVSAEPLSGSSLTVPSSLLSSLNPNL